MLMRVSAHTQVLDALYLSKQTFSKIRQNLCWAFAYNLISLPLAAGAFLPAYGLALTPSISGTLTAFLCTTLHVVCSLVQEMAQPSTLTSMPGYKPTYTSCQQSSAMSVL